MVNRNKKRMKLSLLEYLMVNSPLRRALQRWVEAPWFQARRPLPTGAHVLEIGCGKGYGLTLLLNQWRAAHATGVDVDPRMLDQAAHTIQKEHLSATLVSGDAEQLPFPAQHFDAVVSFGAIHHIPIWQTAIAEAARVTKPGGLLYLYEYYTPLLESRWFTYLFPHPQHRFTHAQLMHEVQRQGYTITHHTHYRGWFGLLIAQKRANTAEEIYE